MKRSVQSTFCVYSEINFALFRFIFLNLHCAKAVWSFHRTNPVFLVKRHSWSWKSCSNPFQTSPAFQHVEDLFHPSKRWSSRWSRLNLVSLIMLMEIKRWVLMSMWLILAICRQSSLPHCKIFVNFLIRKIFVNTFTSRYRFVTVTIALRTSLLFPIASNISPLLRSNSISFVKIESIVEIRPLT